MTTDTCPPPPVTRVLSPVRWICPVCRRTVPVGGSDPHLAQVLTGRAGESAVSRLAADPRVAGLDLVRTGHHRRTVLLVWMANPGAPASVQIKPRQRRLAIPAPLAAVQRLPHELAQLGFVPGKDPLRRWLGVAVANGLVLGESKASEARSWGDAIVSAHPESRELSARFARVLPRCERERPFVPAALQAAVAELEPTAHEPATFGVIARLFGRCVAAGILLAREPDLGSAIACHELGEMGVAQRFLGHRLLWLATNPDYRRLSLLLQAIAFRLPDMPNERRMEVRWCRAICRRFRKGSRGHDLAFWAPHAFSTGKMTGEEGGFLADELLLEQDEDAVRRVFELLRNRIGLSAADWVDPKVVSATARWVDVDSPDDDPGADEPLRNLFRTAAGFDFAFWMGFVAGLTCARHPVAFLPQWN